MITNEDIKAEQVKFAKLFGTGVELREDQAISRIKSRRLINATQRRK